MTTKKYAFTTFPNGCEEDIFFSCGSRHDVKSTMRQMMKSEPVIPSDLRRIDGYSISGVSPERKEAALLIL